MIYSLTLHDTSITLKPMRITALLTVLLITTAAQAAPIVGGDDGVSYQKDRGFFNRLVAVTEKVEAGTSELVGNALGLLGVRYKRGGNSADTGFDCSGFVRSIYEQTAGLLLPRRAEQQAAATQKIEKSDLQPGDLVFFNTMRRAFSHVGIYLGEGKFIHSPKPGAEIRVEDMGISYWARRFDGARRVAMEPTGATASTALALPALPAGNTSVPSLVTASPSLLAKPATPPKASTP